jgi:2-aminobenzoate-CoA ligase
VAEQRATVLFTAPTAYRALLEFGRLERLRSLRRCVSAGETLPAKVWRDFNDHTRLKIMDAIGSTEMLHVFVSAADDHSRLGATGRPAPGSRVAVLGDADRVVPDGTSGRLAVQCPTGCRYLGGDRQQVYVRHGWNYTGDIYVPDSDGWFQARSDDIIVSAGYNIAGPEVEQVLPGHPAVANCAVVGASDPQRGTVVSAFVVTREGATVTAGELQEFVPATIAPYKYRSGSRSWKRCPARAPASRSALCCGN